MTTVKLMTIADVAAALGVTGQAISAWHKGEQHDTPEPPFVITTPHARRKFELLWRDEDMVAWHTFADERVVAMREEAQVKVDKAVERAQKARDAADKALARINGVAVTAEVPTGDYDPEALLAPAPQEPTDIDDWRTLTAEEIAEGNPDEITEDAESPEVAPELGGTEDFPTELADAATGRGRGRRRR